MDKVDLKVMVTANVYGENRYEPHRTAAHESRLSFDLPEDVALDAVMARIGQLFEALRVEADGFRYRNERPKLAEVVYTPEQLPATREEVAIDDQGDDDDDDDDDEQGATD